MVFAIPPPAFHRFSLAFPYLALVASIPFYFIFSLKRLPILFPILLTIVIMLIYTYTNQNYFVRSTKDEINRSELQIGFFINSNFPNRNIYIAAYPGYVYDMIYYFIPGKNAKSIQTEYHDTYLKNFNREEKYLYIMTFPEEFASKFRSADPQGRIIDFPSGYSLFVKGIYWQ